MDILGVTGKQRSGKDTVAAMLAEKQRREGKAVKIVGFADPLKMEVMEALQKDALGAEVIQEADRMKEEVEGFRLLLQGWGSVRRALRPNYFILLMDNIVDAYKNLDDVDLLIIPDLRMPNELDYVKSIGGKILRIERPEELRKNVYNKNHETETALDNAEFDLVLSNHFRELSDLQSFIDSNNILGMLGYGPN